MNTSHCLLLIILIAGFALSGQAIAQSPADTQKLAAAIRRAGKVSRPLGQDPLEGFALRPSQSPVKIETLRGPEQNGLTIRAATKGQPDSIWSYQLSAALAEKIDKGDVIYVSFRIRAIASRAETGEAMTEFVIERGGPPHDKIITAPALAGGEWKWIHRATRAHLSLSAEKLIAHFRLGYPDQTIEIADLQVINMGPKVQPDQLPDTAGDYPGRSGDAQWRKEALVRIEKIRKADLKIEVVSADGAPVADAKLQIKQIRQGFPFGSAVSAWSLTDDSADARIYRQKVRELFNYATIENNLKWPMWQRHRQRGIDAVNWLNENGLDVRGHCLVWPSWRHLPKDLRQLEKKPDQLSRAILEHIRDQLGALKGKLVDCDVINEPYTNHNLMDILGDKGMVDWFAAAAKAAPNLRLFINDYSIVSGGGTDARHQDHYEKTIRYLLDNDAPLGGIGVQSHFGQTLTPPTRVLQILDRFAKFKLPIHVTELDIDTDHQQLQADYFRDFLIAAYSHPAVEAIILWGFWEGRHWRPRAALYNRDWSIRPHGKVWQEWVLGRWRTDIATTTDKKGKLETRGFIGEYELTVRSGDATRTTRFTLGAEGRTVRVELP